MISVQDYYQSYTPLKVLSIGIGCKSYFIAPRRSRRKPIIRTTKSDSAGNKVEFLKARNLIGRSLSFDSGISGEQRNEVNYKEKSRVSHDRYGAMGFTAKSACENPKLATETVYTCGRDAVRRPSYKSRSSEDIRSTKEDVREEITKINGLRQHSDVSMEIDDDDSHDGDDDNDLENQPVSYMLYQIPWTWPSLLVRNNFLSYKKTWKGPHLKCRIKLQK